MIDPANITNFNRSQAELEEFLLFCIVAAGKTAKVQAKKLDEFLFNVNELRPFLWILYLDGGDQLESHVKQCKLGQYTRIVRAFREVVSLNLETCTMEELEEIHGIGSKTARFFILHSRPEQQLAVLDTHILRYMREVHGIDAPKVTPPKKSKRYADLQKQFLALVPPGISVAEFDLSIWNHYNAKTPDRDSKQTEIAGTIV